MEKKKIIEMIENIKCDLLISYDTNRRFEKISSNECITYIKKSVNCKVKVDDFVKVIEIIMANTKVYVVLFQ